jgi:hypothetical protein
LGHTYLALCCGNIVIFARVLTRTQGRLAFHLLICSCRPRARRHRENFPVLPRRSAHAS